MCKELKFYLILEMEGGFPGSPDRTRFEISEEEYDRLIDGLLKPIRSVRERIGD